MAVLTERPPDLNGLNDEARRMTHEERTCPEDRISLIARAAHGDPYAREEAGPFVWSAIRTWLDIKGEMTLERLLGLPAGAARREVFIQRRNRWLCAAHAVCAGDSPWKKSVHLADELQVFQARLWPAWQAEESPPEGCSELRRALFFAMSAASQIPRQRGGEAMPETARQLHSIVKNREAKVT